MKLTKWLPALLLMPVIAQAQYRIDFLNSGFVNGRITDLNNNGVVIGHQYFSASGQSESFMGTTTTGIALLPGFDSIVAINDHGTIIGTRTRPDNTVAAMMYQNGKFSFLNTPGYQFSRLTGINNQGVITGNGWVNYYTYRGLVLQDGKITEIQAPSSPQTPTSANGINDAGAVIGTSNNRAFISQGAAFTEIPFAGAHDTDAIAVNNRGDVAGNAYTDTGGQVAFLYSQGVVHDISKAPGAAPGVYTVTDINASGAVIGYGWLPGSATGGVHEGSYIYANGKLTWLDQLGGDGKWHVGKAFAINDHDQIAASVCVDSGPCQFALLTPVPEPATYGMLLAGLGTVGWMARRRRPAV